MSKIWDDFEADAQSVSGPRGACGIRTVMDSLTPGAKLKLQAALKNPALSNAAIAKALRKRVGDTAPRMHTVSRHRRGDCSCP